MVHLGKMKRFVAGALALTMVLSAGVEAYAGTGADVTDVVEAQATETSEVSALAENPYEFAVTADVDGHDVTLTWTPVAGIEYYQVFDADGEQLSEEKLIPEADVDLSFEMKGLKCSAEAYAYVVKGCALKLEEGTEEAVEEILYEAEVSAKVGIELAEPVVSSAAFISEEQVAVAWDAVENANSYNVYRKEDGGNWSKVGSTSGTTYVDKKVELGTTYYYAVQAVSACCNQTSTYNKDGVEAFAVKAAEITAVKSPTSSTVKATWNEVEGATGYLVYMRINKTGSWKKVADTTDTSYTHKFEKSYWGKTVYFKVYSYCAEYKAPVSNTKATVFKPEKAAITEVKSIKYNANEITWEKVPGVTGYKVYRKTEGGSWKTLATLTGEDVLSYVDEGTVVETDYAYTVKTYWKSGSTTRLGYYDSDGVAFRRPVSVPKMVSVKRNKQKIEVKWEAVSGASGYGVYRKAEDEKSWTRIKRVSGRTTVSYSDEVPEAGVKYNYRVKAYRTVDGEYRYGDHDGVGIDVTSKYGMKKYTVKDSKSVMNGRTLKFYYDENGKKIENIHSIVGKKSKYYIYVNKSKQYVTAYYKEDGYYVPVRSMICSTGLVLSHTPNGTFNSKGKYRWSELQGPCWGQYCTAIVRRILFHSVYYHAKNDPVDLVTSAYNNLGERASHGCVRLTVEGAKWIYDNCKLGTSITIHQKSGYEPFTKPTAYKLDPDHKWDPTDPMQRWRCHLESCHDFAPAN